MGGVISSFFQLVLRIPSKLAPDAIYKDLRVPAFFSKEGFELRPHDWSGTLVAALVFGPSETDDATEEGGSKWGTVYSCGA